LHDAGFFFPLGLSAFSPLWLGRSLFHPVCNAIGDIYCNQHEFPFFFFIGDGTFPGHAWEIPPFWQFGARVSPPVVLRILCPPELAVSIFACLAVFAPPARFLFDFLLLR